MRISPYSMKRINFEKIILYEDQDYIIINKPPFISTLDDRSNAQNILALARRYCPPAQVCHRLDKDTSGCLAIAKNANAYKNAAGQFQRRKVQKVYHAIVDGIHEFKEDISAPIAIGSGKKAYINFRYGKRSETQLTTIRIFRFHSFVECTPISGRLHQVRVHLASKNASISGDIKYGGKHIFLSHIKRNYHQSQKKEELPLTRRFMLHSRSLSFEDLQAKSLFCEAPYPNDFEIVLSKLHKYS